MSIAPFRRASACAVAAWLGAFAGAPALAADPHHQHHAPAPAAAGSPVGEAVQVRLNDTALTDQFGRAVRLKTDVMADRIVVVDFVYTHCTTICPVASALLQQTQEQLGDSIERDVRLVTVTVDPVRDTPARLKAYGARFGSGPGWVWLTGSKPQIDEVTQAFGAWTPNFENHPPVVLVGDPKHGKWVRFYGFPSPRQLAAAARELVAARAKTGVAG